MGGGCATRREPLSPVIHQRACNPTVGGALLALVPTWAMRDILWFPAAAKAFTGFPEEVRRRVARALDIAAQGQMADSAKPMKGLEGGVFEIAIPYRNDAFRAVYAVKIGADIWVIHAFQKKSRQGIKTPQHEIDVLRERLRRLKAALK